MRGSESCTMACSKSSLKCLQIKDANMKWTMACWKKSLKCLQILLISIILFSVLWIMVKNLWLTIQSLRRRSYAGCCPQTGRWTSHCCDGWTGEAPKCMSESSYWIFHIRCQSMVVTSFLPVPGGDMAVIKSTSKSSNWKKISESTSYEVFVEIVHQQSSQNVIDLAPSQWQKKYLDSFTPKFHFKVRFQNQNSNNS